MIEDPICDFERVKAVVYLVDLLGVEIDFISSSLSFTKYFI